MEDDLLANLEHVRWYIAYCTYGSSHHTLIGLLVNWWISDNEWHRYILDSAPSYKPSAQGTKKDELTAITPDERKKKQPHLYCDVVFVEKERCLGIVEVEGTRFQETIQKMGLYFRSERKEFQNLEFGIFLAYATLPKGLGKNRAIAPLNIQQLIEEGQKVMKGLNKKRLVILTLDKLWEPSNDGPRSLSRDYFGGRPFQLTGALVEDGKDPIVRPLWSNR